MRVRVRFFIALLVAIAWPIATYAGQVVVGNVTRNLSFTESVTTGVLATQNIPVPITQSVAYTNGTGIRAVDTIYGKQLTLAATTTTLDLTSLTDPAGNTVNFARVREFSVQVVTPTVGYSVSIYKGASNGWSFLPASTGPIIVQPNGGMFGMSDATSTGGSAGYLVSGSSKMVVLDPGSNTIIINIIIVGGSAAFIILPFKLNHFRRSRRRAA